MYSANGGYEWHERATHKPPRPTTTASFKKGNKNMKKKIKIYLYNEYPSNTPNIATEDDIQAQIEDAFKEENNEKEFGYWLDDNYSVSDLLHLIPTESLEELQKEFEISLKKNIKRNVRNQYFEKEIEIEV